MRRSDWSEDEERILIANYAGRGPNWAGWESLLPGRSNDAIWKRAVEMKLDMKPGKKAKPRAKRLTGTERTVVSLMEEGMTPSEIDRLKGWPPGRSILVLTGRWFDGR